MSDVMDSSYRVFDGIGRLWQRDTPKGPGPVSVPKSNSSSSSMMDQVTSRIRAASLAESELKEMPSASLPRDDNKDNRVRVSYIVKI